MTNEDKIKNIIQKEVDKLYVDWQLLPIQKSTQQIGSIIVVDDTPLFVFEIVYNHVFKHVSFIAKFKEVCHDDDTKAKNKIMAQIIFNHMDSKKKESKIC